MILVRPAPALLSAFREGSPDRLGGEVKALVCSAFGDLDTLEVKDIPPPVPGPGQIAIEVRASALNFPDALMVQGRYQIRPTLPFVPGLEAAGTVASLGAGVADVAVGDRVLAWLDHGGLSERCVAHAANVVRLPDAMPFEAGAALPITYCTTIHALTERAELRAGETLLVLGAAGGVGTAALQIGKALGARVIAVASTPEKQALCRSLGADEVFGGAPEELKARLAGLTGGQGVDVVYDPVGGAWTEAAVRSLRWRGRLLVVGFAAGEIPKLPLNLVLLGERAVLGVFWGEAAKRNPARQRADVEQLLAWYADGRVNPVIGERVRLDQAAAAMARLAGRQALGKIVVVRGG
jgi:NADPH2:quinone reductase